MNTPLRFWLSLMLLGFASLSCGKAHSPDRGDAETGAAAPPQATPAVAPNDRVVSSPQTESPAPAPSTVGAAEDASQNPQSDGVPRETPAGNPISERARKRLAGMIEAYRNAGSYQDDTEFRVTHTQSGPLRLRFERPNKMDARIVDARIVSDGEQRTVYLPHLRQHVVGKAPAKLDARKPYGDAVPDEMVDSSLGRISVPLQLLVAEQPWDAVLEEVVAVSVDENPAVIDGRPHDVIRLDKVRADAVLYVDQETDLIRRLEIDISELLGAEGAGRLVYSLEIKNAQVDGASQPFDFQPPSDSKAVEAFDFPLFPPQQGSGVTPVPGQAPATTPEEE